MINFGKEHCDLWEIFNRSIELRENNVPDSTKTEKIPQMKFLPLTFSTWELLPGVGLAALLGCAWNQLQSLPGAAQLPAPVPFSRRACSGAEEWPSPCPWSPPGGLRWSLPAEGPQPPALSGSASPAALGREGHSCLLLHR